MMLIRFGQLKADSGQLPSEAGQLPDTSPDTTRRVFLRGIDSLQSHGLVEHFAGYLWFTSR
jgi:hypothetical protein